MPETSVTFTGIGKLRVLSLLAAIITFILFLQYPIGDFSDAARNTIACAALMIVLWLTEAMPIPVTALLPVVLFPVMDIMKLQEVTSIYGNPIVFLFMGGFTLALALERWDLHKRIALNIIRLTGTGAKGIMAGFMISTAFLSMWISNTATAVIMLPIAVSVIALVSEKGRENKEHKNFALSLTLLIAYSANIGGMATLIGTPPNIVLKGLLESVYGIELSFSGWLIIGMPAAIILLAVTFLIIVFLIYPSRIKNFHHAGEIIRSRIHELGPMKRGEKYVMIIFLLTAAGWVFRLPINHLIGEDLLSDTNIAIGGALLLFIIPADLKNNVWLMDWPVMSRLPWGILLLFGGGLALAGAMEQTGIISHIGNAVSGLQHLDLIWLVLILTAIMLFMTELMSNVALCTVFIPMVFGIAEGFGINMMSLAVPVTLASSCAFMLPMGTPPNAIVFAGGYIKISQMVKAGIFLNIIAILVIVLLSQFLVEYIN